MTMYSRRDALGTGVAAMAGATSGIATARRAVAGELHPLRGRKIYSESVQVACGDPTGDRFAVLRLCQYPEAGVAWLWAAAVIDGRFALLADNALTWSGAPSVREEAQAADYEANAGPTRCRFSRQGPREAPTRALASFEGVHRRQRFAISAQFEPATGFSGLLEGRSEQFGKVRAAVEFGGRRVEFDGPGQWHEQPQSSPRFVDPFVYASLWGEGTFATLLQTKDSSGGYVIRPSGVTRFDRASFAPPGPTRRLQASGPEGAIEATLREVRHYSIPIYGETWRGAFVRTQIGNMPMIGFANTFPTGFRPA